jgi:hypothetical protein
LPVPSIIQSLSPDATSSAESFEELELFDEAFEGFEAPESFEELELFDEAFEAFEPFGAFVVCEALDGDNPPPRLLLAIGGDARPARVSVNARCQATRSYPT